MDHISLHQLNNIIGDTLKANLEPSYWVVAEIGEMRQTQKGHCYLELVEKEDHTVKAKSRATIWSYTYRNLSVWFEKMTGQALKPGMKILFNATVEFHDVYGLSLNIRDIDANFTLGERARRRTEVLEQLKEDGVYDMNKELPLPIVPQHIAIISSPTAAGYGDFMDQLTKNTYNYHFETELFKATMQGEGAAASIISCLHEIFERIHEFDAIALIRGGGASLDLDCFDDYELASHIAQFPLPVITGIGHERDETVCDLIAHTKMKTPTAVSEFLIAGMRTFEEQLDFHMDKIAEATSNLLVNQSNYLERKVMQLQNGVQYITNVQERKIDKLLHTLKHSISKDLEQNHLHLDQMEEKLKRSPGKIIQQESNKLDSLEKYFDAINPENILKKGYSISKINGKSIHKLKGNINKGDKMTTITHEDIVTSEVQKVVGKK